MAVRPYGFDSRSRYHLKGTQMEEKKLVRNYVIANYDSLQYHKLTTQFATSSYDFPEPFYGCTQGLYIREPLHFNEIVNHVGGEFELLETQTGVVVIFLKDD